MKFAVGFAALAIVGASAPALAQDQAAAPTSATSSAPEATTAPVPAPAPPAPPAPPPLPTTGIAVQVLSTLDNVCIPLIGGSDPKTVAKTAGMRINRDGDLVLAVDDTSKITVTAPSPANPTNCALKVVYAPGGGAALLNGLQAWAARRPIPLPADKVAVQGTDDQGMTVISTWVTYGPPKTEGLVFIQHKRADGGPISNSHEQADILFSIRPE